MFRGIGRGIRIRTLNDGVRVRSVTVTLYLYVLCLRIYRFCYVIITHIFNLAIVFLKKRKIFLKKLELIYYDNENNRNELKECFYKALLNINKHRLLK